LDERWTARAGRVESTDEDASSQMSDSCAQAHTHTRTQSDRSEQRAIVATVALCSLRPALCALTVVTVSVCVGVAGAGAGTALLLRPPFGILRVCVCVLPLESSHLCRIHAPIHPMTEAREQLR
jgi:ABC-type nickel/cobalt efflux system permease component RcnA